MTTEGDDECHPLLVLFDCETTGFSIYSDHIMDIGAKVVATPVPVSKPTFSNLVRTPRNIPAPSKHTIQYKYFFPPEDSHLLLSNQGTQTMQQSEQPLSVVLVII